MDTREAIRSKMAQVLGHEPQMINDDAVLTDLVNSSFLLVEMVIELQEEFDVRFQQQDVSGIVNAGQLIDLVAVRMKARGEG